MSFPAGRIFEPARPNVYVTIENVYVTIEEVRQGN